MSDKKYKEAEQRIKELEKEKRLLAQKLAGEPYESENIEDVQIIVKEKEKPGVIVLDGGEGVEIPTWILDGNGNRWMIRVASTLPKKLRKWLSVGYRKCTFGEIGITDKDIFSNAPGGTAVFGEPGKEDSIVLKIPEHLWKKRMEKKESHKADTAKAMLHTAAEGIDKDARDKYGIKEKISRGQSFDHNFIENIDKKH